MPSEGYQSGVQADEQQRRILQEPDSPDLTEAEDRPANVQFGHEQDRLPGLIQVVAPSWPQSKALVREGVTNITPTQPVAEGGPQDRVDRPRRSKGQVQVNSGLFRNAWLGNEPPLHEHDGLLHSVFMAHLDKDGGGGGAGPGGAAAAVTGGMVHTDVGGRTGRRTKTRGMVSRR